jgi:hypothetical protein
MKKIGFVVAAFAAALMLTGGTAEAAKKKAAVVVTPAAPWAYWWTGPWGVRDPNLAASNLAVGGAATGAYFAIKDGSKTFGKAGSSGFGWGAASIGCAAVSPIVGTLIVNRPLTQREVFVSTANCVVPFVGGMAMNYWFDYYGWDQPKAPARGKRR